jgi:hypothetical protein
MNDDEIFYWFYRKEMGVQNFWQLIESTGRPVNMNKGLEGKVLAIGKKSYISYVFFIYFYQNRY